MAGRFNSLAVDMIKRLCKVEVIIISMPSQSV